jgi:exodeoxyribonuclease-3
MKLVSWNMNGIRSVLRSGFQGWLESATLEILCLQETRIQPHQLTDWLRQPPDYYVYWYSADRGGYSGVATFCRHEPLSVRKGFGQPVFDLEGRVLISEHPGFTLINAYFPSGQRSQARVDFKIEFSDALLEYCSDLRAQGHRLVVCGDLNTAHQPIDLARPKQNQKTSGFLPREREALDRWIQRGFVDIFRHLHPDAQEYSWWTWRFDARARNLGWRIDYFLITEELVPSVRNACILGEILGSDHCPIGLELTL